MLPPLPFPPGALLAAGVSGGADSLALLHALQAAGFRLLVCHFNHRLRLEADADAAHVERIAHRLGLPFVTESADVGEYARKQRLSLEEAARELRYRFLFRQARQAGAQAVVVGHTADDQAETVLMHFLRGAGLSGLKGMPPCILLPVFDAEIPLVRPLLGWTRAQTEAYCHQHDLPFLTDSTNADTTYFRNRLRHELLPHLESYNPNIRRALSHTALALQGDYELLNEVIEAAWKQSLRAMGEGFVAFDLHSLRQMSPALRRNLLRRAAFALQPGLRDVDFEALERAAALESTDLAGGLRILLEGPTLYLTTPQAVLPNPCPQIRHPQVVHLHPHAGDEPACVSAEAISSQSVSASASPSASASASPQSVLLENGWVLRFQVRPAAESRQPPAPPLLKADNCALVMEAWLDADSAGERLTVRSYQPGDRIEPLGMPGQRMKLSDLFINLKIPRRFRVGWPVVCAGEEILWVVGLRMAHRVRCTASTRRVWRIRLEKSDG